MNENNSLYSFRFMCESLCGAQRLLYFNSFFSMIFSVLHNSFSWSCGVAILLFYSILTRFFFVRVSAYLNSFFVVFFLINLIHHILLFACKAFVHCVQCLPNTKAIDVFNANSKWHHFQLRCVSQAFSSICSSVLFASNRDLFSCNGTSDVRMVAVQRIAKLYDLTDD